MTFIDWSDAEEMLGLLGEYVSDERAAAAGDAARSNFLDNLWQELDVAANPEAWGSTDNAIQMLRTILDAQPHEFAQEEVLAHVQACIEELERIRSQAAS